MRAGIHLLGRTRASARQRTHAACTQWAMHMLYRTAWHSGQAGAWGCAQTRPCACVSAQEYGLAARSRSHTLCVPAPLTAWLARGSVNYAQEEVYAGVASPQALMCVKSRTRASPIFSVARNAHPYLSKHQGARDLLATVTELKMVRPASWQQHILTVLSPATSNYPCMCSRLHKLLQGSRDMTDVESWQELADLISACCPNLAALCLEGSVHNAFVHSAFVRALTLPCLSTFEVQSCIVDSMDAMVSAIGCLSSLEHLRLKEIKDESIGLADVSIDVTPLASLSHLQSLSFLHIYSNVQGRNDSKIIGLDAVLQSCTKLERLAVAADRIPPGVHVSSSSLKRLELFDVSLCRGLPDVPSCFPSIQRVIIVGTVLLHDGELTSDEVAAAAVAPLIWQSCSMLSTWPVANQGVKLWLGSNLGLHASTSILRAMAPLKGSSFAMGLTSLYVRNFCIDSGARGVIAAVCEIFPDVVSLSISFDGGFGAVCSRSVLVEAVVGLPQLQELQLSCSSLPDQSVIAACVAAKGRRSGGRLVLRLLLDPKFRNKYLPAWQAAWAEIAPYLPGTCAVSIVGSARDLRAHDEHDSDDSDE